MSKKNKKKQEKIIYYDDNSTIADMSSVTDIKGGKKRNDNSRPQSTAREKWATYCAAVKKMIFPMMVVLAVLAGLYIFLMLLTGNLF